METGTLLQKMVLKCKILHLYSWSLSPHLQTSMYDDQHSYIHFGIHL